MRACVRACAPPSSAYYESTWKRDGEETDRGGKVDPVSRTCSPCAPVCELPRDSEREISIFANRSIFDHSTATSHDSIRRTKIFFELNLMFDLNYIHFESSLLTSMCDDLFQTLNDGVR